MTTVASPPAPPYEPRRRHNRTRYIVAIAGCVVAVVAIVVLAIVLSNNVVYFRTVSEAVHNRADEGTSRFRLAGAVVDGTVHETRTGVRFEVTDGNRAVPVAYKGILPDLFREGQGVVAEGALDPAGVFKADAVLAKHDETYMPKEVADALKKQGHWKDDYGKKK